MERTKHNQKGMPQFSKGVWEISPLMFGQINAGQDAILKIYGNGPTTIANCKLVAMAPAMFYHIVLWADAEGWAVCFDLIEAATGIEYKYGTKTWDRLVKQASDYLNSLIEENSTQSKTA